MGDVDSIPIMRVPLSLPCQVRVLPGTPIVDLPIEVRTELCATDAWWMIGRAMICTGHLRALLGEAEFASLVDELAVERGRGLRDDELLPWAQRHRYEDAVALATVGSETGFPP